MTNPRQFRKMVLMAVSIARKDGSLPPKTPLEEDNVILGLSKLPFQSGSQSQSFSSPRAMMDTPRQLLSPRYADAHDRYLSTSGEQVLRKLEDVRLHVKRIETLVSRHQGQAAETLSADESDREC